MLSSKAETRNLTRVFLSLIPVQAVAVGLPSICTLMNSYIIGNFLGQEALSAVGFASPLSTMVAALCTLLVAGTQVVLGNCLANSDKDGLCRAFNTSLSLCAALGLLIGAIVLLIPNVISILLGATGDMTKHTAQYIKGFGIGIPFLFLYSCSLNFLQHERLDKAITVTAVVNVIVSVGGNALNAFCLHWGEFGSGFFLSVANIITCVIGLTVILVRRNSYHLSFNAFDRNISKRIFTKGSIQSTHSLCTALRIAILNTMIYKVGGIAAMSAFTVAGNIYTVLGSMVEAGYSGATRTMASVFTGYRNAETMNRLSRISGKTGLIMFAVSYAIIFIFARPLAVFFGADAASLDFYTVVIRYANLWFLTVGFYVPPFSILQVIGKTKLLNFLSVFCCLIVPSLLNILLAEPLGIIFLVLSLIVPCLLFALAFLAIYILKARRLPRSIFELCYIPKDTNTPEENWFQANIVTLEDATDVSAKVDAFCQSKGLPRRKAYYCALCIEEMAADAVKYRFKRNKDTLDVQLIYEDGNLHIMLRDSCLKFDPNAWLALCRPEDEYRSLGIKVVTKLAKEMNYINTLGMNLLTIEL